MSNKTLYFNNFLSWVATRYIWLNLLGTWTKARAKWENNAGTWRCIQAALSVEAQLADGQATGVGLSGPVNGGMAEPVTVHDNIGSITYQWTLLVVSQGPKPNIVGATTSSPTWSATVFDGAPSISSWRVTVTDATTGATADAFTTVTLTWLSS
jgi:hypothetical protein